jgi:hypothetical protein
MSSFYVLGYAANRATANRGKHAARVSKAVQYARAMARVNAEWPDFPRSLACPDATFAAPALTASPFKLANA